MNDNHSKKTQHKRYFVVRHHYAWMDVKETQEQRNEYLDRIAKEIERSTLQAIDASRHNLLVQDIPPGVGKSYAVAPITGIRDIGYFVERHDMPVSVPALQAIPEAKKPNDQNCRSPREHTALTTLGYKAPHRGEPYWLQFEQAGSMLYVHNYLSTPHPLRHKDGWAIDEFKLAIFFPTDIIDLTIARRGVDEGSYGDRLIVAIQAAIAGVGRETAKYNRIGQWHNEVRGKLAYDLINDALGGQLTLVLFGLRRELRCGLSVITEHPTAKYKDAIEIKHLPGTGLIKIAVTMLSEWQKWVSGNEFNSLIGLTGEEIKVTRRIRPYRVQSVPSIALLDATSSPRILAKVFTDIDIEVNHQDVIPPPDLKHVWVHTGARYGKTALVDKSSFQREQKRVIKTVQLIFRKEGIVPRRLGVVSYEKFATILGEALGAQPKDCLYFGNLRGSNALEQCDVLLVVGTPTPSLDDVLRDAQAIFYRDSDGPVVDYEDERFEFTLEHHIMSELTQACHRNRPLRHHGRTVITLASKCPMYLPITHEIVELPYMVGSGYSSKEKLDMAVEALQERGGKVNTRTLQKESGVRRNVVCEYLKELRANGE
jgi:hypothetical protein